MTTASQQPPADRYHADGGSCATRFPGAQVHRTVSGGVGHNLPQVAAQAFAEGVLESGGGVA